MTTGEVIRKYRKEKQLTQESMANYLGVSTPAVNKWENGNTYPDVALLGPIARLLGISTDTLLAYREELTDKELRTYLKEIESRLMINREPYDEVFRWAVKLIQEYPTCETLIFHFTQLLDCYRVYETVPEAESYDEQIKALYERLLSSSDYGTRMAVIDVLFRYSLRREELEQAQQYLDMIPDQRGKKAQLQADLFHKQGMNEEAARECEQILYQGFTELTMALNRMRAIAKDEEDDAQEELCLIKQSELAKVLEMGEYAVQIPLLEAAFDRKDKEKYLDILLNIAENIESYGEFRYSKLYKHMKFAEDFDIAQMKIPLLKMVQEEEETEFIRDDQRYDRIVELLQS